MNQPARPKNRVLALPFALLAALTLLLITGTAFAGGVFKLRSTKVDEVSGGWHIYCELDLTKAPSIAHPTVKFLFTKIAVFERDLIDGHADPVINRTVLANQNPSVESLEVDFADPSGKIWNRTRFDFSLTRQRGYESGEYKVQARMSDGTDIGSVAYITLNGENPVVDRRSIAFDTKNPGMKHVSSGVDGGAGKAGVDDSVAAAVPAQEVTASGSAPAFFSEDAFKKQPEEELRDHPKGCGCSVPGLAVPGAFGLPLLGVGLGAALSRRRRSRPVDRA